MRKLKMIINALLAVVIIIMTVSVQQVFAAGNDLGRSDNSDFTYTLLEDGTAEITGYVGEMNGHLIIPDLVDGYNVGSIGGHVFNHCNFTGDLVIPESITSIGERAFSGCGFTGELKLPESLTSIGEYAFNGCRFMGVLTLPASVEYIGKGAFVGSCNRIVVHEIKEGFDKNAFCDSIHIDGKPSMRVDETYTLYIKNNTSQILSLAETSWVSSDPNIAKVNSDGRVTGVSPGKADITIQLYNGMTTKLSIIVEKAAEEYKRGDITWYIPDKIKLGYRFRDEDNRWIDDGLSIAKVENIPEEKRTGDYYCICEDLTNSLWRLFSTLPLGARDLTYPVSGGETNPTFSGFYAVRTGKIIFQLKMWNKNLNTYETWGEPYTVTVEEPVIATNEPQISYVGDVFTLRSELQNTDLENESVNYYKEKVAEAKLNGSSIYGAGENLVYEPQFIIESGAELVETSDGDFSRTLTASEKLKFEGSGTVKIRVKYKHLKLMDEEGCTNGYYDFYSPEKTITIQVRDKPQENILVTSVTLNKKSLDLKKGQNFKLGISIMPADATNKEITWTTSNPKVAGVSGGKVTAKGLGRAVITAKAADGSGKSASCKVTVGYRITYKLNGGKNSSKNPAVYYKEKIKLKNPSRKGYLFKGWYTDKKYKKKIIKVSHKSAKDLTLYAKWEKIKLGKPVITTLKSKAGKKVLLKYKRVNKAAGYQVVYAKDKRIKKDSKAITTKFNSLTLNNLQKKKGYYVKVRAYRIDSTGNKVYGKYSSVKHVRIKG